MREHRVLGPMEDRYITRDRHIGLQEKTGGVSCLRADGRPVYHKGPTHRIARKDRGSIVSQGRWKTGISQGTDTSDCKKRPGEYRV